ncbi:hypothetical protein HPB52_002145 [Rhipicephalus sanguineus]|uniref:Uncharacterized protein n=1 Tax=Rhipicephalus sanguineus TaxID=34632 RepID=A0A9D4PL50_RHISA|nr:hypothetical protein HPB52_002145 [Rhipicephalus sanguineus]
MEVQVNGEDISPEEFLEGAGWCTIGSKTQVNRANAQSNNQTGAHSRTGEGADGNRQRSRQQQRNVRQQVIRNSKMPLLPRSDFKIVVRPRGGLDVATNGTVRLASAIYRAANVSAHEAGEDTVGSNNHQNIIVMSTPHATHAAKYRQLQAITVGDRRHEVSAYETAPDYTVKGIIKGIPLEEDAKSIHTNIVHARNPQALAAKRLSTTATVIVAFEGPRVPTYVRPRPPVLPRCKLCGGTNMTADRNCRARYKTPYVVTKRQCERRRAAEEAQAAATTGPAGKPRSRSRTRSKSRSRARSRTPGPQQHQKRRARSRTPRGTPTGDTKTAESVSFADAIKGKRAPTAEAGGKTPTKIEAEIAQITQAMHTMQRQIEHMQAQIRAKDELIQQLQSAANSESDPQAMQETQEEPTDDDEVEGPDTKRRPAPTPLKAARLKRTRAAIPTRDSKHSRVG